MLGYFLLGVALGAGSSVLPGPCNLAVLEAALRHGLRRAIATGVGAALGDFIYAALGIVGIGALIARHPAVPPVLLAVSGAMMIGYGLATLRRARHRATALPESRARPEAMGAGLGVGLATLLCNPGALITWVVIVGSQLAGAGPIEAWSAVVGIGTGSCAWFTGVAHLAAHGQRLLPLQRVTHVVSCLLVAYGVVSIARAAHG
jgi:L-lysine exporter family protein LysE/ArgO